MSNRSATGVYIAYPTTDVLKPIYRKLKTLVNSAHTKIGITTDSFAAREREYMQTFHGEVQFIPVAEVPAHRLHSIEQLILGGLCARYSRVGKAREWFHTTDRDAVVKLIAEIVEREVCNDTSGVASTATAALDQEMRISAKELGNAGERRVLELLSARGYDAHALPTNAPTYDVHVSRNGVIFFISVKVARDKQHVRLGSRKSVSRLNSGNFVFAFLPKPGKEITAFDDNRQTLLILPAELVRNDSLRVHDAYYAEKGRGNEFSVMVKGYGRHHKQIWPKWMSYANAWHLLP